MLFAAVPRKVTLRRPRFRCVNFRIPMRVLLITSIDVKVLSPEYGWGQTGKQIQMTTEEILASTALNSWKLVIGRVNEGIASLDEERLQRPVAPGKNRLLYLLGHLTVTHDRMFPMLGLGEAPAP